MEWFVDVLPGPLTPLRIKFRRPTHDVSETESKETIEAQLRSIGPIEELHFYNNPKSHKFNITASFFNAKNANAAVQELDGYVEDIGVLSVKPLVCMKFNVPANILEALRADLNKLKKESREEHRVQVQVPPPQNISKPKLSLHISAEGVDAPKLVAQVKVKLEKLLAGMAIINAAVPLWHAFFGTPSSIRYLKEVSYSNQLYIHRDLRKSQLILYGGAAASREAAKQVLVDKVTELNFLPQTIVSTSYASSIVENRDVQINVHVLTSRSY